MIITKKWVALFAVCMLVFSITFLTAETFTQNKETNFSKTCTNTTGGVCSATATCSVTVRNPRTNLAILNNIGMTNAANGLFNYTFTSANLNTLGNYPWDLFCCDVDGCGEAHGSFQVTKTGVELTQDKATIYLGMLAMLVFLFLVNIIGIVFLPSGNNKSEDGFSILSINNLKYVRDILFGVGYIVLIAIVFASSNIAYLYLETEMVGALLFTIYRLLFIISPLILIVWLIWIIISIMNDKEMRNILERGGDIPVI